MRTINLYTFNISILRRLYDIYKYYLHTVFFIYYNIYVPIN